MAIKYQKSEAQWSKQYREYIETWSRATFKASRLGQITTTPLTIQQFKSFYGVAKQTLQVAGKSTAGVYKQLITSGPLKHRAVLVSKESAKAAQILMNAAERKKPVKERHYWTIKELMVSAGQLSSEINEALKSKYPTWSGSDRASYISETVYGSEPRYAKTG